MHGTIRKKSQEIKTDKRRHITDKAGHIDSVKQRNNKTKTTRLFLASSVKFHQCYLLKASILIMIL